MYIWSVKKYFHPEIGSDKLVLLFPFSWNFQSALFKVVWTSRLQLVPCWSVQSHLLDWPPSEQQLSFPQQSSKSGGCVPGAEVVRLKWKVAATCNVV